MTWQVLVVEDDAELRDALADILTARGFRVRTAANGAEALERIRVARPAVIVLDLMMPVMDGPTFLEHRAEDPTLASIPVIVLTAQIARMVASTASADVVGVLAKPLELGLLFALIRKACDRPFGCRPLALGTLRSDALPRVTIAAGSTGHDGSRVAPGPTAAPNPTELLLVDDDEELRDALVDALAQHGYRVVTAANGFDALAVIRQGQARPCVILLDLMMPVMDGVAFLQHHAIDPAVGTVPVVVLTAKKAVAETLVGAVVAVLPKPIPMPRLLEILRAARDEPQQLATRTRSMDEHPSAFDGLQERRVQRIYAPRTLKPEVG